MKLLNFRQSITKIESYSLWNDGSATSKPFCLCHQKLLNGIGPLEPFILSLSSNSALMTAISNDKSYENVFSDQISQIGKKTDILITISSSGNSKNIVKAIKVANAMSMTTISFTGFSGGKSKIIADKNIHINSHNYGVVESYAQLWT